MTGSGLLVQATIRRAAFSLELQLTVGPGEVLAVLGPNGAGKSTLLQALAGLLPVQAGRIVLGERVLDDAASGAFVEAAARSTGYLFQDYRLFPRLSALDNVAFGLRTRRVPVHEARARAAQWLDRVGVGEFAARRPEQLSGGQAQRVALARALAAEPELLLLDEPLSALDVQTRAAVQAELVTQLRGFAGPTLIVTHDPVEAMVLSDRIVVLESGRIVQEGTPAQIVRRPATTYVARLVGVNLFSGEARSRTVHLAAGRALRVDVADGPVLVAVRPSAITLHAAEPVASSARQVWAGRIASLQPLADRVRVAVAAPGEVEIAVDVTPEAVAELDLLPGRPVWVSFKQTDLSVYPQSGGPG